MPTFQCLAKTLFTEGVDASASFDPLNISGVLGEKIAIFPLGPGWGSGESWRHFELFFFLTCTAVGDMDIKQNGP